MSHSDYFRCPLNANIYPPQPCTYYISIHHPLHAIPSYHPNIHTSLSPTYHPFLIAHNPPTTTNTPLIPCFLSATHPHFHPCTLPHQSPKYPSSSTSLSVYLVSETLEAPTPNTPCTPPHPTHHLFKTTYPLPSPYSYPISSFHSYLQSTIHLPRYHF